MKTLKIVLTVFALLFFLKAKAQDRQLLEGKVTKNDSLLENVHARNLSSGKSSVTNNNGVFYISSKIGDTLLFTHVGSVDYIKILKERDFQVPRIEIRMQDQNNELKEVSVSTRSEINAVSLGIIPKQIEKPSINERRLQTAGDFKWYHVLSLLGGGLKVDPILNAINGRTKQLKRNIEVEKKLANIAILEAYTEYMQTDMGLNEEEIRRLLSLAVEEDNIQLVMDSNNGERIKFFLLDTWLKFNSGNQEKEKRLETRN